MRAAVIEVALASNAALREDLTRLSTALTHTDPKALHGAHIAAELGALATLNFRNALTLEAVALLIDRADGELRQLCNAVVKSIEAGQTPEAFTQAQGWTRNVSGYIFHMLSVALHAWLCYPNSFAQATQSLIRCGGDTDSTASLLGIWMGAQWGAEAIPAHWLGRLKDPLACPASLYRIAQCATTH